MQAKFARFVSLFAGWCPSLRARESSAPSPICAERPNCAIPVELDPVTPREIGYGIYSRVAIL